MQVLHGATCLHGCLDLSIVHPGSIVRFSSANNHHLPLPPRSDQLAVILRSPDAYSGAAREQDLYHCVLITRTPLTGLGAAHRVRHVHEHEVAYTEANGPFDLLIVQELIKGSSMPAAQLQFDHKDCVQPASVQRIPRRCLHQLPGHINLSMVGSSLEALLRRVDGAAGAIGAPARGRMLPEELNERRRREDIITLGLLRVIDRMMKPADVAQQPSGVDHRKSRKTSIWDQGTVPRNGGRG